MQKTHILWIQLLMSNQQGTNPILDQDVRQRRGIEIQSGSMPDGSSKLTKEKQMRGAFYFGITQGAISIDINPSTVQIQKSGETVMQQLPNKSPNFHRKLNSPNQSPNYLRN